jgi:hypothetical protein
MDDQFAKLFEKIEAIERRMDLFARKLDETRRKSGLSPIIDDQTAFINQRKDRGFAA